MSMRTAVMRSAATALQCANFVVAYNLSTWALSPAFAWNTNLHDRAGNIVRLDGRVDQFSNAELRADILAMPRDDTSSTHYISPR